MLSWALEVLVFVNAQLLSAPGGTFPFHLPSDGRGEEGGFWQPGTDGHFNPVPSLGEGRWAEAASGSSSVQPGDRAGQGEEESGCIVCSVSVLGRLSCGVVESLWPDSESGDWAGLPVR